jgi:hypothetical protein
MSIAPTAFFDIRKTKSGASMSDERHDSSTNDTKADKGVYAAQVAKPKGLSLLKTVNYRESLRILPCDRRTVGRHDHHSICSCFHALVPVSQPSSLSPRDIS